MPNRKYDRGDTERCTNFGDKTVKKNLLKGLDIRNEKEFEKYECLFI